MQKCDVRGKEQGWVGDIGERSSRVYLYVRPRHVGYGVVNLCMACGRRGCMPSSKITISKA